MAVLGSWLAMWWRGGAVNERYSYWEEEKTLDSLYASAVYRSPWGV